MESEIIVIRKSDLMEMLEKNNQKILDRLSIFKQTDKEGNEEPPKVKRLNTREIKEMLGVGDTTFEKIQEGLPMHRTKTGRLFAYEHDLIVHLFREHPPYFDIDRFWDYITQNNLIRHIGQK
jgi:hypothetical protein